MYMSRMIEVGKAANGFVVECRVPFKPKTEKSQKDLCGCYPGSCEKQFVAKDTKEVGELIGKLLPMLEETYTDEKAFDSAFKEATNSMEGMGDD